jgi:hypothetical protein
MFVFINKNFMNIFLSIAGLLIVFSTPSEAGYNSMTGAFSGAFCSGSYVGYYNATPGGNSFCNTFGGHTMVAGETCYCNTSCTGFDGLNNGTYANCFCFHGSGNVPCPSGSSGSGGGGSGGSGSGGGGSGGSGSGGGGSGGGGSGGGGATCPPGTHCCGGGGGVGPGGSGLETGSIQFIDWLFGKINPIQCSHAAMVPGGTDPCSVCCPNATPTPTPNTGTGTTTATATATATFAPIFTPTPSPTTDPFGTGTVTAGPIGFPSASPPAPSPSAPCTLEGEYRPGGTGACVCPPNYQYRLINGVNACRPNLPLFKGRTTSDFFLSSDPISNYYPVCGSKRIAVTPGGAPLNVSSNSWPNSTSTVPNPTGTGTYLYAKANGSLPEYLYPAGSWCACTFKEFNTTSAGPATAVESSLKIPPDTFGAISSVTSKDNVKTSPVPIGHDSTGTIDARVGDQFAGAIPKARCGCADLNAEAVALDPAHPNDPQGAYCRSMIPDSDPHRVLVEFNPAYHDVAGSTQVVNRSEQPQISNVITTRIALPLKTGASAMKPYTRRIWACSSGFTVDVNASPPVCVFDASKHMCSNSVNGALASAVTIGVTGSTPDIQFTNAINKKHNCCIAAFSKDMRMKNSIVSIIQKLLIHHLINCGKCR